MSNLQTIKFEEHQQEIREDIDYEMHERAGLVYWGRTDDGEDEWVGTDQAWKKYNSLIKNLCTTST